MRNFDAIYQPVIEHEPQIPVIPPQLPRKKKRRFRWLLILIVLIVGLGWGGSKLLSKTNKIFTNKENIFVRVGRLIIGDDKPVKGEENGQVNILLLGIGGPGHEGPNLTDTMIVASINTVTNDVILTSIPRDFLVQLQGRGFNKINAAYAYAELDEEGTGGNEAIRMAEKVTGLTIPYFATVDFKGFVKAVDHVGGLDVTIDRTFTDSSYPDYNNGYMAPVTFTKGNEHMDGERSLIFARSRKGNNGEGSDFSRSTRQKKIMVGMKDKLLGLNITDLGTLNKLLNEFTENFRTNFEPFELKRLAEIGKKISGENVYSISLEPEDTVICNGLIDMMTGRPAPALPPPPPPPADGEETEETTPVAEEPSSRIYVVQPCEGKTLVDVHNHLQASMLVAKLQSESAVIEIQNSTGKSYVTEPWQALARSGVNIKFTTFRGKNTYDRTILYDNSKGAKPRTLEYMKSNYNFDKSDVPFYDAAAGSNFVIILGKDAL